MGGIIMTIEERAREYADVHKATEFNYFGVGQVYGYERIYNAEITAYERGAKEQKVIDIEKTCEWLKENIDGGVHPSSTYGFVEKFKKAMEE